MSEEAARRLAEHDLLSGLPNRMSFTAALDAELARSSTASGLAVLCIDLDGLKDVNDCLGHEAGDKLIVGVGQRMKTALRGRDWIARFGGDEFAVMLTDISAPVEAEIICKRLFAAMKEPFDLGGRDGLRKHVDRSRALSSGRG